MKVLLLKAVLAAIALGALSSCSFFQRTSHQPSPLSKAEAERMSGLRSSSGPLRLGLLSVAREGNLMASCRGRLLWR